ncbi:MAG: hypothetical protein ABI068_15300 [Ktedonobacterales bacterium]
MHEDVFAGLPDEYAALGDPRLVMRETLALVDDLRRCVKTLGDALVSAGLPARAWLGDDAMLDLLSGRLPALTIDDFLTALAEFAADTGPHLLHGGADDLASFADEVAQFREDSHTLRMVAQRQRYLRGAERDDLPLALALADARLGAPLDKLTGALRDLEALLPFLIPLTPDEWDSLTEAPPAENAQSARLYANATESVTSHDERYEAYESERSWDVAAAPEWPGTPTTQRAPTLPLPPGASAARSWRRLRDYAQQSQASARPYAASGSYPGASSDPATLPQRWAAFERRLPRPMRLLTAPLRPVMRLLNPPGMWALHHRLAAVLAIIALLATLVGVFTLTLPKTPLQSVRAIPTSHLKATPAHLALACAKGASGRLTLANPTKTTLTWKTTAPSGMTVSSLAGTLKPGADQRLTLTIIHPPAAHSRQNGTLTITASDGQLPIPYTLACK